MHFCPNCGKEIGSASHFCPDCGAALPSRSVQQEALQESPSQAVSHTSESLPPVPEAPEEEKSASNIGAPILREEPANEKFPEQHVQESQGQKSAESGQSIPAESVSESTLPATPPPAPDIAFTPPAPVTQSPAAPFPSYAPAFQPGTPERAPLAPAAHAPLRAEPSFTAVPAGPYAPPPFPQKKKPPLILFILLGVVVLAAAVTGFFLLSNYIQKNDRYQAAHTLLADQKYDEAKSAFLELEDFKDAGEQALMADYEKAQALLKEKKYDEAQALFESLGGFKDSADKAEEAVYQKQNDRYQEGQRLLNQKKYAEAEAVFTELADFKDSTERAEEAYLFKHNTYIDALLMADNWAEWGAAEAESLIDLTYEVWYNAIFDEGNPDTAKYMAGDADFDTALDNLYASDEVQELLLSVDAYASLAESSMKELKDPLPEYQDCYDAVKELYDAFLDIREFAQYPVGSLKTYGSDWEAKVENFVNLMDRFDEIEPERLENPYDTGDIGGDDFDVDSDTPNLLVNWKSTAL